MTEKTDPIAFLCQTVTKIMKKQEVLEQLVLKIIDYLHLPSKPIFKKILNLEQHEQFEKNILEDCSFTAALRNYVSKKTNNIFIKTLDLIYDDGFLYKTFNSNGKYGKQDFSKTTFFQQIMCGEEDMEQSRLDLIASFRTIKNRMTTRNHNKKIKSRVLPEFNIVKNVDIEVVYCQSILQDEVGSEHSKEDCATFPITETSSPKDIFEEAPPAIPPPSKPVSVLKPRTYKFNDALFNKSTSALKRKRYIPTLKHFHPEDSDEDGDDFTFPVKKKLPCPDQYSSLSINAGDHGAALYDWEGEEGNDISVKKGNPLLILDCKPARKWLVKNLESGKIGKLPKRCVKTYLSQNNALFTLAKLASQKK